MYFSRQFLLLFTIWVHSIIPDVDACISKIWNFGGNDDPDDVFDNEIERTCGLSRVQFSHVSTSSSSIVRPHRDAKLGDWPWMGAMFYYNPDNDMYSSNCGSMLITDRWVLTAAHCISPNAKLQLSFVRFGTVDNRIRFHDPEHQIDRPVDVVVSHPEFNLQWLRHDIALVRLKEPVPFSDYVKPACLSLDTQFGDDRYDGERVYLSGWGQPSETNYASPMLKDAPLLVTNIRSCARQYFQLRRRMIIDQTIICAGQTGSASCFGDSGGPLVYLNPRDNRLYAIGIVSTGGDGCDPRAPSVLTRISHYMPWILETINAY